MRKSRARVAAGGTAVLAAAGLAWAATGTQAATKRATVSTSLAEFKITPSKTKVAHGSVRFTARNRGSFPHELLIIRTSRDAAKIPTSKSGKASERGRVAEIEELNGGKAGSVTVNLKKGHYVLLCNVGNHYKNGMRRNFTVT